MRVLLLSAYELGHQPLHVASPAAALGGAGHQVRCRDLALETLDGGDVAWAEAVAVSVPMHTAARLAVRAAELVRQARPLLPVCAYGLYAAAVRADTRSVDLFDLTVAGEYEAALVDWVAGLAGGSAPPAGTHLSTLARSPQSPPARHLLPPLDRYARLAWAGEERVVGYAEATRGCSHRCLHCPVPIVYGGRVRKAPVDTVVADVDGQVDAGARHITFGDPDFLNAPGHAMEVVRRVHGRHPELTFDATVKVEHLLRHRRLLPELAASGLLFVVSAYECLNDAILARLDKGHTAADAAAATDLLRQHGIEVRPSFLPFTPWAGLPDILAIVDFVIDHDLVSNVEPVQYSIRLLLPPGSPLVGDDQVARVLGNFDAGALTYRWTSPDPAMDALHLVLAGLAEARAGEPPEEVFPEVHAAVAGAALNGGLAPPGAVPAGSTQGRPRLTEPWFC